MQLRLLGDTGAPRVDHHQPGAVTVGGVDLTHEVQVAHARVIAPHDDQLRQRHLLQGCARSGAERRGVGGAADAAAQRSARKQRRPQAVKEAQRHRVARQHAVRPGVVERQHGFGAMLLDDRLHAPLDELQRFGPGELPEPALALRAAARQRMAQAVGTVDELRIELRHLGAHRPMGDGICVAAAHREHALLGHRDRQAAGVGAVERTYAGLLHAHGGFIRAHGCFIPRQVRH